MAAVEVTVAKQSSARDDTGEERAGDGPSFASRVSSRIRLPAIGSARPRRTSLRPTSEPPPIGQHPPHSLNESDSTWARSKRPCRDGDAVFAAAETRRLGNPECKRSLAPRGRRRTIPRGQQIEASLAHAAVLADLRQRHAQGQDGSVAKRGRR